MNQNRPTTNVQTIQFAPVVGLLQQLSNLPGPSGQEDAVLDFLEVQWRQIGQVTRHPVGNLVLNIKPDRSDGLRVPHILMAAHADERSYQVKSITRDGFLRITGGHGDKLDWPPFVSQKVRVLGRSGELSGLLATTTGHVMTDEQQKKQRLDWTDLFVDIGASSAAEARAWGVEVGCRIVWATRFDRSGNLLMGKAMDDRAGLAVLTQVAQQVNRSKLCFELTIAATVQEEINLIGAASLMRNAHFDYGLIVDNGLAGDVPTVKLEDMPARLGGGPILVHRDSSTHYHRGLLLQLEAVAKQENIPIQHALLYHYGSDGSSLTKHGLPTALLAPPVRYSHSPVEVLSEKDLLRMVALLKVFLETEMA